MHGVLHAARCGRGCGGTQRSGLSRAAAAGPSGCCATARTRSSRTATRPRRCAPHRTVQRAHVVMQRPYLPGATPRLAAQRRCRGRNGRSLCRSAARPGGAATAHLATCACQVCCESSIDEILMNKTRKHVSVTEGQVAHTRTRTHTCTHASTRTLHIPTRTHSPTPTHTYAHCFSRPDRSSRRRLSNRRIRTLSSTSTTRSAQQRATDNMAT